MGESQFSALSGLPFASVEDEVVVHLITVPEQNA
jgi:hypothetical protein